MRTRAATTERPIIMSADSVRAILDGRKTQTRRVVKPQPLWIEVPTFINGKWVGAYSRDPNITNPTYEMACPYGQPGDRLWVREKWRVGAWDEDKGCVALDYSDGYCRREWLDVPDPTDDGQYFNDLWIACTEEAIAAGVTEDEDGQFHWEPGQSPCSWRPSVFMPRWASRLLLEITDVRAERLWDIAFGSVLEEGYPWPTAIDVLSADDSWMYWRDWYIYLWDSINAKRGYSWDSNPWVWVVEFRRVE